MKNGSACYTFRAQNGFGGMGVASAVFSGKEFIVSDSENFRDRWNEECVGKAGEDITEIVSRAVK